MAPIKKETPEVKSDDEWMKDLHYKEYLKEIMQELETDPDFKKHVESTKDMGNISLGLEFVHHSVRSKLDEIKRREVDRLRKFQRAIDELKSRGDHADLHFLTKYDLEHIDHDNRHSFEVRDLQKLIEKVHSDLKQIDRRENEEHKQYEMAKDHERKEKINETHDPKEKEKLEKSFEEAKKRHQEHAPVHHPGSEEQLKDVWKEQDHLDPEEYNPKSFFKMHDLNGDGRWDPQEIEALMQNELNKVYQENNTDDDINERYHEMMRMRQEMMKEGDTDRDDMITWDEFQRWTSQEGYKRDAEWKTEEESGQRPYTDEEYDRFEKEHYPPPHEPPTGKESHPAADAPAKAADPPQPQQQQQQAVPQPQLSVNQPDTGNKATKL